MTVSSELRLTFPRQTKRSTLANVHAARVSYSNKNVSALLLLYSNETPFVDRSPPEILKSDAFDDQLEFRSVFIRADGPAFPFCSNRPFGCKQKPSTDERRYVCHKNCVSGSCSVKKGRSPRSPSQSSVLVLKK